MMNVSLQQVAQWLDGRLCDVSGDEVIHQVATDSRRLISANTLFFALEGDNFDGHDFVSSALEMGATAVVVAKGKGAVGPRIEVEDTLDALQKMAAAWRSRFEGTVVGITGSNGKTIVKEMAAAILSRGRRVYRSPGSYNSQVGVALAVLGIRAQHQVAIIEAGVSKIGEMERLEAMIRPDVGLLVSIGEAHLVGLGGSLESTAAEKLTLFRGSTAPVILPAQTTGVDPLAFGERAVLFHVKHSEGSIPRHSGTYVASSVERSGKGFSFELAIPSSDSLTIAIGTPGRYNVSNATAAATLALELGASRDDVVAGLASFEAAPMRMEMHTTQSGVTILNDAYVSDPTSARTALEALDFYAGGQRKIAILGDMRELGDLAEDAHRSLGEFAARLGSDHLIAVGANADFVVEGARRGGIPEERTAARGDLEGLARELETTLEPGDFVLFKGSRAIGLERVASSLVESVAPERLEIDLDAICENVRSLRREMGPKVGMMAVVKSFAYGNDSTRVSQTLVREGVEWLVVAYPDEAIPLRRRGIDVPILVTNVMASEADKFAKYDLTALVSSPEVVTALGAAATARGVSVDLHLEVDTGMNRMGIGEADILGLAGLVEETNGVRLEGLMTHLAAADDESEDDFTRSQLAAFEMAREKLESAGHAVELVHAANTAGAWRFPEARYDFVRVGLGLYGVAPGPDVARSARLVPALRFTTRVLQVRSVAAGETVGYGRSWRAERPSRVATIAIGYNDGFPRFMSNGGEVLVRGKRCPVVGNVCMDATMVDVTDLESVEVGDEVVLFGEQGGARISVDEIASRGATISYEILTGISPRVRRIFKRSEG